MCDTPATQFNEICGVKNQKAFMADLKSVYRAATKEAAEIALEELDALI